jgi:hypothetical protein
MHGPGSAVRSDLSLMDLHQRRRWLFLTVLLCLHAAQEADVQELEQAAEKLVSLEREIKDLISTGAVSSDQGKLLTAAASKASSVEQDLRQLLYNKPFSLPIPPIIRSAPSRPSLDYSRPKGSADAAGARLDRQRSPAPPSDVRRSRAMPAAAQESQPVGTDRARREPLQGEEEDKDDAAVDRGGGGGGRSSWEVRRPNGTVYTTLVRGRQSRGRSSSSWDALGASSSSSPPARSSPAQVWRSADDGGEEEEEAVDDEGRRIMVEEGERVVQRARALLGLVRPTADDARGVEAAMSDLERLSRRITRALELADAEEGGETAGRDGGCMACAHELREVRRKSEDVQELLRQLLYNLPSPSAPSGVASMLPSIRLPWLAASNLAPPPPAPTEPAARPRQGLSKDGGGARQGSSRHGPAPRRGKSWRRGEALAGGR